MRKRRRIAFLASVVALLVVSVVATLADGSKGLWATHPFLSGMTTGALTLAFTVLIVNRYLSLRDGRRWRRVAAVAYRGLARESRDISASLASLYCDLSHIIGASYLDPEWRPKGLSPIGEIRAIPNGKDAIRAFLHADLPPEDDPDDLLPAPRVKHLASDEEWSRLVADHLASLVDRNRDAVARWAPLMMEADEPRDLLDAFASLNEELFMLHVKFRQLSVGAEDLVDIEDVVDHWRIIDGKARILTNTLWRLAGEGHYSMRLPSELEALDAVVVCRTVGRLGPWRVDIAGPVITGAG
jgi:hypothetical protein